MSQKKSYFVQYLLPAVLTLAAIFGLAYYFSTRPDYQAMLVVKGQPYWQITGNSKTLEVVSLSPFIDDKEVMLLVNNNTQKSHPVGIIPHQGNGAKKRFSLPSSLEIGVGDKLEVVELTSAGDIDGGKTLFITRLVPVAN